MPHLLYLHGFASSPYSKKAQQFSSFVQQHTCGSIHCWVPCLPYSPQQAMAHVEGIMSKLAICPSGIVGSSLGGFYATYLSQKYQIPAVLINPAVAPYRLLQNYLGWNRNYHTQQRFLLQSHHIDELKALEPKQINQPGLLRVLLQTADETLDYTWAEAYYQGCDLHIGQGGSHAFENFSLHCSDILGFLLE